MIIFSFFLGLAIHFFFIAFNVLFLVWSSRSTFWWSGAIEGTHYIIIIIIIIIIDVIDESSYCI